MLIFKIALSVPKHLDDFLKFRFTAFLLNTFEKKYIGK